jgi:hypothetical protein
MDLELKMREKSDLRYASIDEEFNSRNSPDSVLRVISAQRGLRDQDCEESSRLWCSFLPPLVSPIRPPDRNAIRVPTLEFA